MISHVKENPNVIRERSFKFEGSVKFKTGAHVE